MLVPLPKGLSAEIDDEDWPLIQGKEWHVRHHRHTFYAYSNTGGHVHMHRLVLGLEDPRIEVDHRDGNGLNNKRYNLRPATRRQNSANTRRRVDNKSGFKGVSFYKRDKVWQAVSARYGKQVYLGRYATALEAALAYDDFVTAEHGEFARPNFTWV